MPETSTTRKISTKHWIGVRGVTQEGQQYEFQLESDFYTLLRMDHMVESYLTQPCKVAFETGGKPHVYTPDVLIRYLPQFNRCPELIEVKPAKFANNPDPSMRKRFEAGVEYAERQGWLFRVVTEDDMPPNRVENARFLLRYKNRTLDHVFAELALSVLAEVESASLAALIQMCQQHSENRARVLTEVWTLIATRRIGVDLDEELTMRSVVWSLQS